MVADRRSDDCCRWKDIFHNSFIRAAMSCIDCLPRHEMNNDQTTAGPKRAMPVSQRFGLVVDVRPDVESVYQIGRFISDRQTVRVGTCPDDAWMGSAPLPFFDHIPRTVNRKYASICMNLTGARTR